MWFGQPVTYVFIGFERVHPRTHLQSLTPETQNPQRSMFYPSTCGCQRLFADLHVKIRAADPKPEPL